MTLLTLQDVFREMRHKPRTGWVDHGIKHPETVWQHCRGLRTLARDRAPRYLGPNSGEHCAQVAACHDVVEGIVPDITRHMDITRDQKAELEHMAIDHIGKMPHGGARVKQLWLEYQLDQTEAGQFLHLLDKLQMVQVALRLEKQNASRYSLQPFWDWAQHYLLNSSLAKELADLQSQRPHFDPPKPLLNHSTLPSKTFEQIRQEVLEKMGAAKPVQDSPEGGFLTKPPQPQA